jgi:hypothetical protein
MRSAISSRSSKHGSSNGHNLLSLLIDIFTSRNVRSSSCVSLVSEYCRIGAYEWPILCVTNTNPLPGGLTPKTRNHFHFHSAKDIVMPWSTVSPRHNVLPSHNNIASEDDTLSLSKSEHRHFEEKIKAHEYALVARTAASGLLIMQLAVRSKSYMAVFLALFANACTAMADIQYLSPYWSTAKTNACWGFVLGSAFLGYFGASRARMEC